jgi:hypothetical protein
MNHLKPGIFLFVVLVFCGCTATRSTTGGYLPNLEPVAAGSKVLIMTVPDGVEAEDGPAQGSGRSMANALKDALLTHGFPPFVSESTSLPLAFQEAADLGFPYVLRGSLTKWEDNATEWSGRPDLAELSVELYATDSKTMVASVTHSIEGGDSGKQPHRFVPELADQTLSKIFGWTARVTSKY